MPGSLITVREYTENDTEMSIFDFGYIAQDQIGFSKRLVIYNNYDALANVGDALAVNICAYDDEDKNAATEPIVGKWIEARQVEYNGVALDDQPWTPIGGSNKLLLPYNSAKINGSDGERGSSTIIELRMNIPHDITIYGEYKPYICLEYEEA